jgi:hypothetical protein
MAQHKWHKEIKAWADGAKIEFYHSSYAKWVDAPYNPDWSGNIKYRIKPQPKEPKYLKVYGWLENGNITFDKSYGGCPYIGKIKLEDDDAM